MITRISTAGMHRQGLANMLLQQAQLAKVQQQIASGQRLTTAADDPAAAVSGLGLDQALAELGRYGENARRVQHRLGLEENALSGAASVMTRVRELSVAVNSGIQTDATRRTIAVELRVLFQQLLALANSADGEGRYLFGGTQNATAPFAQTGVAVVYNGDQGQRSLEIAPGEAVADGDPGSETFQRIRTGNGTFAVGADPANTGTAVIAGDAVTDPSLYAQHDYQIDFLGGNYTVTDTTTSTVVVASAPFTAGAQIAFDGIAVTLDGVPADGDRFTVTPSVTQDVFASIQDLIAAVEMPVANDTARAAQQNRYVASQQDLQQAFEHLVDRRAALGARLNQVDAAEASREAATLQMQQTLSDLRDLDYAEATTRLNQLLVALQAAQQSYQLVQGSTLFDFLR